MMLANALRATLSLAKLTETGQNPRRSDHMAVPWQRDPKREALLRQGAAEITRLNPHIGTSPPEFTEEECAAILRADEELDALWNSPEGRSAQALGYSAADAVGEDRSE
jgi:hypothetical protein